MFLDNIEFILSGDGSLLQDPICVARGGAAETPCGSGREADVSYLSVP